MEREDSVCYYDYQMPELSSQRVNPSVKVSWVSSSNADGYDVTIKNANGKAASQTVHVGKNVTSTNITLNTADSGSYTAEVKAIKGTQSKSVTRSFSLKSDFVAESEASTIKVPVVFPNTRFVCNRCGREVSGKVKDHIIPIDSTELRERYADSLYTYKYQPTAGTNNAWVAAWAGTPDVTLTAGYYDLGDYFWHPLGASDPDLLVNCIWEDSLERSVSIPFRFSLAELQEKINNCGNQTYINFGIDFWLKCQMSTFHRDIEGCTSAYHEEDCVSISGLQTVVIPATGYTRVSLGTNQPYEPPTEPPTEEPTEEPKITAPTGVKYEVTSSGSVDYEKIITYNLAYTTEKNKVCRGTKFDAKEDGLTNTSFGMEHSIEYIGDGKARLSIDLDPAFIKENIKKNGYLELEIKFASKSSTVPILGVYADGTTSGTVTQDIILNKVSDTYPEIKVSWNKVPNADSYSVYVIGGTTTVNGQNLMKYFTDLKTTSCSFTITEQYASSFFVGNIGKPWYCNEFTIYVAATRGKQSVSTSKTFAYSEVNRPYNANDPYVYVDRVVEWK